MRVRQFLVVLISLLILLGPILAVHDLTDRSVQSDVSRSNSSASAITASPLVSQNQLLPGHANLVGSVNVRNLPETGSSSGGQNVLPIMYSQGSQAFNQGKNETNQPGFVPPGENSKNVATAPITPQVSSATVNLVLNGAPGGPPNPCACTPPDPNNAVGPNHVFEMVNTAGIIYLKNGMIAKSTFPLSGFFALSGGITDPQVLYDAMSGRWFASIVDVSNDNIEVAVSTSSDPAGIFNLYSASAGSNVPDQPYIGTSNDKFVIAANDFDSFSLTYSGVQYWIVNKAELVSGSSTVDFLTNTPDSSMQTLRPVRHLTSTSVFFMATNCIGSCVNDMLTTTNTVEVFTVNGVPPGTVSVTTQTFSTATSTQPPNAVQRGTSTLLVTNDNRILSAVWESSTLWLSWADACIPTGDTTTRSCVRLIQATISGNGTATKNQDFDYASKSEFLFYPAASLYHGQLVVVFGKSSASLYPSVFVTGRLPSDPANSLVTPATIRTGTADDLSTRYGDYFGAGTDPSSTANSTFWVSGEYRTSTNWNTVIAQVGIFAPDFAISARPSNITLLPGNVSNSTITLTGYKFTGNVNLTASVVPTMVLCDLQPSVLVLRSSNTSRLSCIGSEGNYTVTVTGASNSVSHSVSIFVTVHTSGTVGGSVLSVNKLELLLPYLVPGLAVLMMSILGAIVSRQSRAKKTHLP